MKLVEGVVMGLKDRSVSFFRVAVIATGVISAAHSLDAQMAGTGSIQGVVSDPSGAAVPNATVIATNNATGVSTTRQTTQAGYYVLSPLVAGTYTVTVNAGGFEKLTQQNVVVDALAQVGLNLTVQVGGAAQEVTVTGAPPALNTADASMGQTMRNEIYSALPLQRATHRVIQRRLHSFCLA